MRWYKNKTAQYITTYIELAARMPGRTVDLLPAAILRCNIYTRLQHFNSSAAWRPETFYLIYIIVRIEWKRWSGQIFRYCGLAVNGHRFSLWTRGEYNIVHEVINVSRELLRIRWEWINLCEFCIVQIYSVKVKFGSGSIRSTGHTYILHNLCMYMYIRCNFHFYWENSFNTISINRMDLSC